MSGVQSWAGRRGPQHVGLRLAVDEAGIKVDLTLSIPEALDLVQRLRQALDAVAAPLAT